MGNSIALFWNQFSGKVDMILISRYTFSVNSFLIFHQSTKIIKSDKVIYTITFLEQVFRKLSIIFTRLYNSHVGFEFAFCYSQMQHSVECLERIDKNRKLSVHTLVLISCRSRLMKTRMLTDIFRFTSVV